MNISLLTTNILIHVLIMSIFLTIFFFTVAKNVEKDIVKEQIRYVLDDFIGNTFKGLDSSQKQYIKKQINEKLNTDSLKESDKKVQEQNKIIFNKSLVFLAVIVSILFFIIFALYLIYRFDIKYIKLLGISALISLIFVAVTETSFLLLIAKSYLSADPNQIKFKIIKTLSK